MNEPVEAAPRGRFGPARRNQAVGQSSLREHNLAMVMREVIAADGRATRAKIAKSIGVTRAAVSGLIDQLLRARLVVETDHEMVGRAGRPGLRLAPARRTVVGLGMQVQVDQLSVRATDLAGEPCGEASISLDLRRSDPAATLARLADLAVPLLDDLEAQGCTVAGVCLSIPGVVSQGSNIIRLAPNLGWAGVDVVDLMNHLPRFGDVWTTVGNDADLAARAETQARRAQRVPESFLFVAGRVGIGGALVLHGSPYVGLHGWSGEIGHCLVDVDGPVCTCGSNGCLEVYAGQDAIVSAAGLDPSAIVALSPAEQVDWLLERAAEDDPVVLAALDRAADALGVVLSTSLNVVDVATVVLGGVYDSLFSELAPRISRQLDRRVLASRWERISVERSRCDADAAVIGAGLRVLDTVVDHPARWVPAERSAERAT